MLRILPLPAYLLGAIREHTAGRTTGPIIGVSDETMRSNLTKAWKGAIEAKEVRQEVYHPVTRDQARPDHAFRGFVQTHLRRCGIPDVTIDVIVGHSEGSTRDRHYHEVTGDDIRDALAMIPAPSAPAPTPLRAIEGGRAASW